MRLPPMFEVVFLSFVAIIVGAQVVTRIALNASPQLRRLPAFVGGL